LKQNVKRYDSAIKMFKLWETKVETNLMEGFLAFKTNAGIRTITNHRDRSRAQVIEEVQGEVVAKRN
jgi:hypothetical protein